MSLLKMACETYDFAAEKYAGVYEEGKREPLAPIAHTITSATIEITIDKQGKFITASEISQTDSKTIFPVTEESQGRTSAPEPHPLCEQLQYLSSEEKEKNELYLRKLRDWQSSQYSHPFVSAVLEYVNAGTIMNDIKNANIKKNDGKAFVRWRVIGVEGENEACWKNRNLQNQFIEYYQKVLSQNAKVDLCMLSGKKDRVAMQHAKGIVSLNGNAKLISANDKTNFTFKGRFRSDDEALTISYETSQKAHNALRWLIANQGEAYGGRSFLCWTPEGKKTPRLVNCMMPIDMNSEDIPKNYKMSDYKEWLHNTLVGWKKELFEVSNVVTVVFDAATTGRLAITYYSELPANDFLMRIAYWDDTCCFINRNWGIQSPSLYDIAKYSLGTYRGNDFDLEERIAKQAMLRLLVCRLEQVSIPTDMERALVNNAGHLLLYDERTRNKILFTVCAVIKKHKFDYKKEEWNVALEPGRKDRSYQYGRLLAVLEKEERDTYSNDEEGRETNAIRMQSVFVNRPLYATRVLTEQIKRAYVRRLSPRSQTFYEKLIGEIMEQITEFDDAIDKPLEDTYLLGYYLQKNALYTKAKEEEN